MLFPSVETLTLFSVLLSLAEPLLHSSIWYNASLLVCLHQSTCFAPPPAVLLLSRPLCHMSPFSLPIADDVSAPPPVCWRWCCSSPQILAAYKALMERLLSMLGAHNATQKSKEIIQLETRLANVSWLHVCLCTCVCALLSDLLLPSLLLFRSLCQNTRTNEKTSAPCITASPSGSYSTSLLMWELQTHAETHTAFTCMSVPAQFMENQTER